MTCAASIQVLPSDVGQRQPFYFLLQPSYWRPNQVGKGSDPGEDPESPLMSSSGTDAPPCGYVLTVKLVDAVGRPTMPTSRQYSIAGRWNTALPP